MIVALILLLALAARLGWALTRPTAESTLTNLPDQVEYLSLARSLLRGDGLSMVDARFNDTVQAFRMPGYPVFGAVFRADVRTMRIAQSLIDASTILATIWLARRWLSPALSYMAGAFVAADPIQIYFSSLILSETTFTALLTWGIACLAHGRSPMARGRGGALWWTGVALLILSIYIRPSAFVWPLLIVGAAVIHEHGTAAFKPARRLPTLTLVALLTTLALLPWAIRNRTLLGRWVFTTTNDGVTLYDAWSRDADGQSDQSTLFRLPLLTGLNEVQRSDYLRSLAWQSARDHPLKLIQRIPSNLGRLWAPFPLSAEFGSKRLYVIGAACHSIPLFLLAFIGLIRADLARGAKLFLITPALIVSVMHGSTIGSLRYRMPVHPELAVLAAAAMMRRSDRIDVEAMD